MFLSTGEKSTLRKGKPSRLGHVSARNESQHRDNAKQATFSQEEHILRVLDRLVGEKSVIWQYAKF